MITIIINARPLSNCCNVTLSTVLQTFAVMPIIIVFAVAIHCFLSFPFSVGRLLVAESNRTVCGGDDTTDSTLFMSYFSHFTTTFLLPKFFFSPVSNTHHIP